jgi:hypothetical protein
MPTHILLQPCGAPAQANFRATVRTPVPREKILLPVGSAEHERLASLLRDLPAVSTWALTEGGNPSVEIA